jgi:hypothetical protein
MSDLALRIQIWVTTTLASMKEERGQDLTEYALWTGVIALTLTGIGVLIALTSAVDLLAAGIGDCIDFNSVSDCNPV